MRNGQTVELGRNPASPGIAFPNRPGQETSTGVLVNAQRKHALTALPWIVCSPVDSRLPSETSWRISQIDTTAQTMSHLHPPRWRGLWASQEIGPNQLRRYDRGWHYGSRGSPLGMISTPRVQAYKNPPTHVGPEQKLTDMIRAAAAFILTVWVVTALAEPRVVPLDELEPTAKQRRATTLITQLLSRHHYKRTSLNDAFSSNLLDRYLKALDPNRSFFFCRRTSTTFSARKPA